VIALALPVFVLADWPLTGWALAAILWVGLHAIDLLVAQLKARSGNAVASGAQVFGMLFKALGLLVVLFAAVGSSPHVALAAALTYMLAYTLELGLSLLSYYGGPAS
jgi:hypothetical protein